jgi:hypothetical protein
MIYIIKDWIFYILTNWNCCWLFFKGNGSNDEDLVMLKKISSSVSSKSLRSAIKLVLKECIGRKNRRACNNFIEKLILNDFDDEDDDR